jgi:hypothetical protein
MESIVSASSNMGAWVQFESSKKIWSNQPMASEFSFDIISKPDMQEVKNALQQVEREI